LCIAALSRSTQVAKPGRLFLGDDIIIAQRAEQVQLAETQQQFRRLSTFDHLIEKRHLVRRDIGAEDEHHQVEGIVLETPADR